jgi:hypothetical protein
VLVLALLKQELPQQELELLLQEPGLLEWG